MHMKYYVEAPQPIIYVEKYRASHQLRTWHKINGWAWKYIMIWVYLIIVFCRFIASGPNTCRKSKCGGLCPLNAWQSCTPWSSGKATWRREKFRGLWSVLWMKFNYGLQNVFLNVCFWWLPSGTQILLTPTCPCVMSTLGPALSGCRSEAHRYVGPTSDDFWIYNFMERNYFRQRIGVHRWGLGGSWDRLVVRG